MSNADRTTPSLIRPPRSIIHGLAAARGMVTPLPLYFPLNAAFTAECIREAYRDVIDALTDAAHHHPHPETAAVLRRLIDHLTQSLTEE